MTDVRRLIDAFGSEDAERRPFLAPCLPGAQLRVRVGGGADGAGLIRSFEPRPRGFEGWGIFRPADERTAELVEEAGLGVIERYLELFPAMRVQLGRSVSGRTWLAFPVNESDFRQRFGEARPLPVHLVDGGTAFETAVARFDGACWWFHDLDRRADPMLADRLRASLREQQETLEVSGTTPEMRAAYEIAWSATEAGRRAAEERLAEQMRVREEERIRRRQQREAATSEGRLRGALRLGGAELDSFRDRGDYWVVSWTERDGRLRTSAITKRDLTVVSAGICLSGRDQDFDLQSLVGVVGEAPEWAEE